MESEEQTPSLEAVEVKEKQDVVDLKSQVEEEQNPPQNVVETTVEEEKVSEEQNPPQNVVETKVEEQNPPQNLSFETKAEEKVSEERQDTDNIDPHKWGKPAWKTLFFKVGGYPDNPSERL